MSLGKDSFWIIDFFIDQNINISKWYQLYQITKRTRPTDEKF